MMTHQRPGETTVTPGEFLSISKRLGYRRRWVVTTLCLHVASILFEGIGVGIFLPVLQYMNSGGDIAKLTAESRLWRELIDVFAAVGLPLNLATLLTAAFVSLLARQGFTYVRMVYLARVGNDFVCRVRDIGFQRFLRAELGYHDHLRTGDVVNEMTTELKRVVGCMNSLLSFFGFILQGLAYVGVLLVLSATMTGIAVAILLIAVGSLRGIMAKTRSVGLTLTEANQQMSSFLVERLKSVRLVRLSGTEAAESRVMTELNKRQRDRLVSLQSLGALLKVVIEPMVIAVALVMLYFAVTYFDIQIERIFFFFLVLLRLLPVIKTIMVSRQGVLGSMAAIVLVDRRLAELETARGPEGGSRRFHHLKDNVRFEDVSFAYGEKGKGVPALKGTSLEIPAGKITAIVGPSGAGKSTLIDLLPRLRDPCSGRILIDGLPHTEFMITSLRAGIAFAPQVPVIFNVSVTEHIRYGLGNATAEQVREAAKLAQADEFIIRLPEGYDTMLGESGIRLSGGQRQRLDLARALVRQAPILILDEPTSNLDADSEALLREALSRIRRETDITIIIVGHRLSTLSNADIIVTLEGGKVTATGSHASHMAEGGWYARAYSRQMNQHGTGAPSSKLTTDVTG